MFELDSKRGKLTSAGHMPLCTCEVTNLSLAIRKPNLPAKM